MNNIFKKKPAKEAFTLNHPDLYGTTELAFKAGGKEFYRFKEEYKMPAGRYKYVYAYAAEAELKMTRETLGNYLTEIKAHISGGKGKIDLEMVWRLILNMETRLSLGFEPECIKRLASVTYFTEDEILTTYDQAEGQAKIDLWNKHNTLDFFLTKPMDELLGLRGTSQTSLVNYLTQAQLILQDLMILEQPLQSPEKS